MADTEIETKRTADSCISFHQPFRLAALVTVVLLCVCEVLRGVCGCVAFCRMHIVEST